MHFLEFGIWAFKANGQRSETDLILQQDIQEKDVHVPLVLTEWKKINSQSDTDAKIDEAIAQCKIYEGNVLRPMQLNNFRFVILVSKKPLQFEPTKTEGTMTYLIRNIVLERDLPSKEART